MKLSVAPLLLATLTSCAISDDAVTRVEQGVKCDDWMCGTNSPVIASHGFWDLNLFGTPNRQGFTLDSFRNKYGAAYSLKVMGGRFIGEKPATPNLEHDALKGSRMYLSLDGALTFVIEIVDVEQTTFWASLGKPVVLETYLLKWAELSAGLPKGELQNLCSTAVNKPDLGMNGLHTTVFEGERIDAATKTINSTIDKSWFNLGCAGSALAKLQLIGHTEAAQSYGYTSSIAERQTALKMITAAYCGGGAAFTVAGQPLDWADDRGTLTLGKYSTLEARWTKDGATCLNTPRVIANPSKATELAFPNGVMSAIAEVCGTAVPPPCGPGDLDGYHLMSANPPPIP